MAESSRLEHKNWDDSWYYATIELKDNILRIVYDEFQSDEEEVDVTVFKTVEDVESVLRLESLQLQDDQCNTLKAGTPVCASCTSDGVDNKFYDAIVKKVEHSVHSFDRDQEECTCRFGILWQAGPNAGQITYVRCENICLRNKGRAEQHPILNELINIVCQRGVSAIESALDIRNTEGGKRENSKSNQCRSAESGQRKYTSDKRSICWPNLHDTASSNLGCVSSSVGIKSEHVNEETNHQDSCLTTSDGRVWEMSACCNKRSSEGYTINCSNINFDGYSQKKFGTYNEMSKCVGITDKDFHFYPFDIEGDQFNRQSEDQTKFRIPSAWGLGRRRNAAHNVEHLSRKRSLLYTIESQNTVSSLTFQERSNSGKELIEESLKAHKSNDMRASTATDLGGSNNLFGKIACERFNYTRALVLDNLENGITVSEVIDAISNIVSLCDIKRIIILPTYKFENMKKGIVVFTNALSLEKVYGSLQGEEFFIVSSKGRPWIPFYCEEKISNGKFGDLVKKTQDVKHQPHQRGQNGKMKFVHKGSHDYEKAKRMKSIFMKFRNHLSILHKRLEYDESLLKLDVSR